MKNAHIEKYILVLHGPNMNIVSLKPVYGKQKITLNKINKCLRKEAKKIKYQLKIMQTNDESVAVTMLQRHRNKTLGIIIFPGPWQKSAHALKDTLEILQIPYVTISTGEDVTILSGINNIKKIDLLKSCKDALTSLTASAQFE